MEQAADKLKLCRAVHEACVKIRSDEGLTNQTDKINLSVHLVRALIINAAAIACATQNVATGEQKAKPVPLAKELIDLINKHIGA